MNARRRDPLVGTTVAGRYEVLRRIGKGGMGSIYEVLHKRLGRTFAMKTLRGDNAEDPEMLSRFRREAEVVAKLRHRNIVNIVDWEALDDGSPCLVMDYLDGEDLAARIKKTGPLPWLALARISDEILSALESAHAAGIVHRDLKPQNIFLARDDADLERSILLDFGVSKIRDASRTFATTDARMLGTPAYMSPEQADGRHHEVDEATDVWAMGAIIYQMATARPAFSASSVPSILYRICHGEPDPLLALREDAPEAFVQVIAETLSRDPEQRIDSATMLRERLRSALGELASGAYIEDALSENGLRRLPSPEFSSLADLETPEAYNTLSTFAGETYSTRDRARRRRSGRLKLAIVSAGVIAALGAVAAVSLMPGDQSRPAAAPSAPSVVERQEASPAAGPTEPPAADARATGTAAALGAAAMGEIVEAEEPRQRGSDARRVRGQKHGKRGEKPEPDRQRERPRTRDKDEPPKLGDRTYNPFGT